MSLCHSIIVEESNEDGKLIYHSTSPDEMALVNFARFSGWEYIDTDNNGNIKIKIRGENGSSEEKIYKLEYVLEFSSFRKRMSVIVKDGNDYILYSKGAESTLLPKCKPDTYISILSLIISKKSFLIRNN